MQEKKTPFGQCQYELSLAEFPIFNLCTNQVGKDMKSIVYRDTIRGKDGKFISREWLVTAAKEYGFGTISTLDTFFVLFQIWKEEGFITNEIHYGSIRHILKRRNLSDGKENYDRIIRDLSCLAGLTITATNAFFDNVSGEYVSASFHLVDNLFFYESADETVRKSNRQGKLPFAKLRMNEILHRSAQANLLLLDHDETFWLSLNGIEKRLYLYLSKVLSTKLVYKREILELASQIPIQAKSAKKKKQTLKNACHGLISKGFSLLAEVKFIKASDNTKDIIVFIRNGSLLSATQNTKYKTDKERWQIECLVEDILEVCGDEKSRPFYIKVARTLDETTIRRALSETSAAKNGGEIKTTAGQFFTFLIQKYTQEDKVAV